MNLEDFVWTWCGQFAMNPSRGRRAVIFGSHGIGKSKAVKCIRRFVKDTAINMPVVIKEDGSFGLPDCILVNWAIQVDSFKKGHWDIDDLLEADMLILDDVGAEHDPSKVGAEKLYHILERREYRWTLITTNIFPKDWDARLEKRIADRFVRHSQLIDLIGVPSYSENT